MEMPLISVVVPIYKAEKYIERCVNSLLSQSYENIEVLLIDDGSPDKCPEICDKLAKSDSRIKVIHKSNGGVSSARNAGIDASKGEYLTFVDADDYVKADYISKLYNAIKDANASIAMCGLTQKCDDKPDEIILPLKKKISFTVMSAIFIADGILNLHDECSYVWGKMWKKDVIKVPFSSFGYSEDALFNFENSSLCDKIAIINEPLYIYVRNGSSITGTKTAKSLDDSISAAEEIYKLSQKFYPQKNKEAKSMLVTHAFFAYVHAYKSDKQGMDSVMERAKKIINQNRATVMFSSKSAFKTRVACFISCVSYNLLCKLYFAKK